MARSPITAPPVDDARTEKARALVAGPQPAERVPLTDPGIPTPELPLSEARSFEGYISAMPVGPQTAPISTRGPIGWARANLFNSPGNAVLTVVFGALALLAIYGFVKFALLDATWVGTDREACLGKGGQAAGACWPMITE